MKELSKDSLISLMGGAAMNECGYLQDMANEHEELEDEQAEKAWWDAWSEAYERCVRG